MDFQLSQYPFPESHILKCCGDSILIRLFSNVPIEGKPFVCTNIGNAHIHREEIIQHAEKNLTPIGQDWNNIPMIRVDDCSYQITLALAQEGHFELKCGILCDSRNVIWVKGNNAHVNVMPASYCSNNTVYCAFVRQFGKNKSSDKSNLSSNISTEFLSQLESEGFTIIPSSGTFRDLQKELDHIINKLKCRIIHLLPITPPPTTFAKMGRFGSPYASQDFTKIDPALAEFDKKSSPLEQFYELVDDIHTRGAKIIIDIAINHTGWASKLQEKHSEWFVRQKDGTYVSPGAWGVIWGDLIELDHNNPKLWAYLANVFLVWCKRGVDGFRCDAGYMIPANAWEYIIAKVRSEYPETLFLLEGLGGPKETTQDFLNRVNMNWAYSELFQNYNSEQIHNYLNYAWEQSKTNGLLIHYAETHDNNRLAASGKNYSKMRVALSALASSCGSFGFTNGVEWFATEKIDVHENNALNWGAKENQVNWIEQLNIILSIHPAFFNEAGIGFINQANHDVIVFWRCDKNHKEYVLIAINLNCNKENEFYWDGSLKEFHKDYLYDLLNKKIFELPKKSLTGIQVKLKPAEVICLSPDKKYFDFSQDENVSHNILACSQHLIEQQAKNMVLRALVTKRNGCPVLFENDDMEYLTNLFLNSAECFLQEIYHDTEDIPYTIWEWPKDLHRVVMLPPNNCLFVTAKSHFQFTIRQDNHVLYSINSIRDNQNRYLVLIPPIPVPEYHTELDISVYIHEKEHLQRSSAKILLLAKDIVEAKVYLDREECLKCDKYYLQTNGCGAISHLNIDLMKLQSKYDAILLANLDNEIPVDRHIMWRCFKFWVIYRSRRQEVTADSLHSFYITSDRGCVWNYKVPLGNANLVGISMKIKLIRERNAVRITFHRHTEKNNTKDVYIANTEQVTIIVSPQLEDRNFHSITKAYMGAQRTFPNAIHEFQHGFEFSPAKNRKLYMYASMGSFIRADKWEYMVYHAYEAERGQESHTDLFSPGYFKFTLSSYENVYLTGMIKTSENDAFITPIPQTPETFNMTGTNLKQILKDSLREFIVKRNQLKTIIAGYPWFLDWGRDTLIVTRGLIASQEFHEDVKKILLQFASLAKNGTICNMISGTDTGNRDTSDAQLWLIIAVRDLCKKTSDYSFLDTEMQNGATLRSILIQLVKDLMHGTPNGILYDEESSLLFSPPHFTWMDTNYPAGTPREGYPIEIESLWYASLKFIAKIVEEKDMPYWLNLANKVQNSIISLFYNQKINCLSDCLHCKPGTPANKATPDDHIRPNQLYAITLGVINDKKLQIKILYQTSSLLVPGAIRSLDDSPVSYEESIFSANGQLLHDSKHPYCGQYVGDEDTRRKVAYHNGTAWSFIMPLYPEAYLITYGNFGKEKAISILSSMALLLNQSCLLHINEIFDGDAPHISRGCDAQAWSISEFFRVWKILHKNS